MEETTSVRLKKALDIRNMKQIDLSIKTGIGKSAISQYLSGKVIPKQDKLYLIAKALNVQESWLMGHNVPMELSNDSSDSNKNKKAHALEINLMHGLKLFTTLLHYIKPFHL